MSPDGIPGQFEPIGQAENGQFTDASVTADRIYAYDVRYPDGSPKSVTVFSQPLRLTGLRASVETNKRVLLRWEANYNSGDDHYNIYRADGKELETGKGKRLNGKPIAERTFVDDGVDLSDGIIRSYWVTAVNKLGVESGPSPLAHTVPDSPEGFVFLEGIAPSNGEGVKERYTISWRWPADQKIAGFNVYHATEHIDTLLHEGGYDAFWKLWTKLNDKPAAGTEYVFEIPKSGPPNHYFYVRAGERAGPGGFYDRHPLADGPPLPALMHHGELHV